MAVNGWHCCSFPDGSGRRRARRRDSGMGVTLELPGVSASCAVVAPAGFRCDDAGRWRYED
ncbi:hypothetical protein KCP78_08660 [Salmonella enterica subsp. enterica]|nr:hypothetical protein KCP78_08660 [Salmonella enterica subsp. enterica]